MSDSSSQILTPSRRGFLKGLLFVAAAPVIVRATSIMPVRSLILPPPVDIWLCKRCGYRHGGCCLDLIRDMLLPGLRTLTGRYEAIPSQWTGVWEPDPPLDARIASF